MDKNLCGWRQSHIDSFDWELYKTTSMPPLSYGPYHDHSPSQQGSFYTAKSQGRQTNETAVLASALMPPTSMNSSCFIFWYSMNGPNTGDLSVNITQGDVSVRHFLRSGPQAYSWQKAYVSVNSTTPYFISIEAKVIGGVGGDFAVAHVVLTKEVRDVLRLVVR